MKPDDPFEAMDDSEFEQWQDHYRELAEQQSVFGRPGRVAQMLADTWEWTQEQVEKIEREAIEALDKSQWPNVDDDQDSPKAA